MTPEEIEEKAYRFAVNNSLKEITFKNHFELIKETYKIAYKLGIKQT